ncbi:MAG: amino acid adenylation domain-containing protein, partial [Geminicoccaceae bacterium]
MTSLHELVESLAEDGFVLVEDDGRVRCAPTGRAVLDAARAQAVAASQDALARHVRLEAARRRMLAPIAPAGRDGPLPLSHQQRRLWLAETCAGGTGAYNIPTLLHLRGALDRAALAAALAALVARHEILRTVFGEAEGRPFQRVLPPAPVPLPVREVGPDGLSAAIEAEAAVAFDLEQGPLLRAVLLRLAPADHALLLLQHHLVSDGWSIDLLVRELAALYAGGPTALPPPRLHYGDVAAWQAQAVDEAVIQLQLAHWREALGGWEPLELRTDRPRHQRLDHRGAQHHFAIAPVLVRAVAALARAEGTTPFVVLAAAFQALLRIHARQDDVTITTALAGRTHLDLARLPGFFVNLVPLRARFAAGMSFRELLAQVDAGLHEALSHQDLPYERLVTDLDIPREPGGGTALERAVLVLQTANAGPPPAFPGLAVEVTPEADLPVARFELTCSLQAVGEALAGRIAYSTALYDAATIERLGSHYVRLIEALVRDPAQVPTAAALLRPEEFERCVLAANRTRSAYPRAAGLVELFARRVAGMPQAPAIREGARQLTFAELDRRADLLAGRLAALGIGERPGAMVALRLERGIDLVVAMLGILKAGAAYVPIDPRYPIARQRYMLAETAAAAMIVAEAEAADPAPAACPLVVLHRPESGNGAAPACPAGRPTRADDLAYVCFTSGTTGAPKGVLVEQRAVARLVLGNDYVALAPGQRIALASNAVFDAVTFEIWGALLNGATLVVLDRDTLLDAEALAERLMAERIDVLWLTTALFDQLAGQRPDMFRGLDWLLVGGGALNPATIAAVLDCPAGAPRYLVNGYGPTENTTFSTCHRVTAAEASAGAIPIGWPIRNSTAYVLDPAGLPVPPGVVGELHVGGDGLARGYLNDPQLTAARFARHRLSHPGVAETVETRLYATGD